MRQKRCKDSVILAQSAFFVPKGGVDWLGHPTINIIMAHGVMMA